jgi:hypothetical protein
VDLADAQVADPALTVGAYDTRRGHKIPQLDSVALSAREAVYELRRELSLCHVVSPLIPRPLGESLILK